MRTFKRNPGQALKIGDDIEMMVLGIQGNQVRLGINAPKEIPVHREEIYQRIQQQGQPVHSSQSADLSSKQDTSQTYTGYIANVLKGKGFGFIYVAGFNDDVFFHASDVEGEGFEQLNEGMAVTCTIAKGERGLVAQSVAVETRAC